MSYAEFRYRERIPRFSMNAPAYMFEGSAGYYPFPARYTRPFYSSRTTQMPVFPSYWTQYSAFYDPSPYGVYSWPNPRIQKLHGADASFPKFSRTPFYGYRHRFYDYKPAQTLV